MSKIFLFVTLQKHFCILFSVLKYHKKHRNQIKSNQINFIPIDLRERISLNCVSYFSFNSLNSHDIFSLSACCILNFSRKLSFSSVSNLTDVSSLVRLFSFLIFADSNSDSSLEILTAVSYFSVCNKVFSSCNCLILSRNFSTSGCLSCLMFSF